VDSVDEEIAIEHELETRNIRAEAEQMKKERRDFAEAMNREIKAAMIAVAAAAHALDALYGALKDLIPNRPTFPPRATRNRMILETLKRGFDVGKLQKGWVGEFRWLFRARDAALHFRGIFGATVPHPLGTNTAPEAVLYSCESATRALVLLLEVLNAFMERPRRALPEIVKWAADHRPAIERLLALGPTQ
jgi:hypothetical protein